MLSSWSLTYLSRISGSQLPLHTNYHTSSASLLASRSSDSVISDFWLVNGQYQPQLTVAPKEWRILDVMVASADRVVSLLLTTSTLTPTSSTTSTSLSNSSISGNNTGLGDTTACDMYLLQRAGVYLASPKRISSTSSGLLLLQQERVSLAIRCSVAGDYYLHTVGEFEQIQRETDFQLASSQLLMSFSVRGVVRGDSSLVNDLSFIRTPSWLLANSSHGKNDVLTDLVLFYLF
jgi:hypothetical protein